MKCIAAVVMMALALAVAEGSLYSYAPLAYSLPHTTVVQDNSYARYIAAPWGYAAAPAALSYAAHAYPTAAYYQPAVAVVAQKEARYLAANRGAVHDAPLPGHEISQQSLNLAPAPGTL
ncbi:adult cuticle protein 1-like [Topomyia yanbarensis]|uniref:adult cuticle protein 1-like n=1 Tax=Topomyia yanbarensis TaxID=2498891 RepID=UPI00273A780B|nr:adult cuticle protein 1-like [Topomyia yanbarensis]